MLSDDFLKFMLGCFVNFVLRLMDLGCLFQVGSYENTLNAYNPIVQYPGLFYHDLFSLQHTFQISTKS